MSKDTPFLAVAARQRRNTDPLLGARHIRIEDLQSLLYGFEGWDLYYCAKPVELFPRDSRETWLLDRRGDLRVPAPGMSTKVAMIGAFDFSRRKLIVHTNCTKRSTDFIAFLEKLDNLYGPKPGVGVKPVVIVLDNGPIHTSKATRKALAARDHWLRVEWLPKYAPELNDIENVWAKLKALHLAHLTFDSRQALDCAIHSAVEELNLRKSVIPLAKPRIFAQGLSALKRAFEFFMLEWKQGLEAARTMSVFAPPCVDELAAFLAANPVCCTLTPTEVAEVVFALQVREVAPGELIIREGEPGDAWFLVYRGVCEVQRAERLLARLHVGAFFGEMSVLDGAPRSATVQAKSAVTLLRCPSSVLQALLQAGSLAAHKVVLEMTRELARRMRALLDDSSSATLEVRTTAAAASRASEG